MDTARHLVETAVARSARDLKGRAWLMVECLKASDYRGALTHLTAMGRVSGAIGGLLHPVLRAIAAQPEGREALADLLATPPPWRTSFLKQLAVGEEPVETSLRLFSLLSRKSIPPTFEETAPLTQRLAGEGRFELAYGLWLNGQTPDAQGSFSIVHNGEFEHPVDGSPFDWTITPAQGVWIGTAEHATGDKQLRVVFDESEGQFQNVSQMLMLIPGEYELSVVAWTENLDTRRGIWWRVACVGGPVIGTTDAVLGSMPRTVLRTRVSVPRTGCPAQILRLELAARGTFETRVSGEARFDNVQIQPIDAALGR